MANPRVMKAITVDVQLALRAKEEGLNLSRLMDATLKALFDAQDGVVGPTPESIAADLSARRTVEIQTAVASGADAAREAREAALLQIQPIWNKYASQGPKPTDAKLAWVRAHRDRFEALRQLTPESILKELEG